MEKIRNIRKWVLCLLALTLLFGVQVQAAEEQTIHTGIYAEEIDLSGKTTEEAQTAIAAYVDALQTTEITLEASGGHKIIVTAQDLGMSWVNTELPEEALAYGKEGNVIERYKIMKDLEHAAYRFPIALSFDAEQLRAILTEQCLQYDQKAVNTSVRRNADGSFEVIKGMQGVVLNMDGSVDKVCRYLTEEWDRKPCHIALEVQVDEPKGDAEELSQITDLLGSFTTSYSTSSSSRCANVENGCRLINGTTLYPGEEFSTYDAVSPFSTKNGYYMAGSYMNGRVVNSLGGGICQVSTTLYNAVLLAELEVTERHNHSMIVTYVDPSADAAIAESSGKDFKFVNNLDYPIYIEGYTENKEITFNIYGKDTREDGHSVKYESKVLEVRRADSDAIYADGGRPVGYISTESGHTGYKAQLWKVVQENGEEISREMINESSYKMTPRSATVGVATDDPVAYNEIIAAIGTGSIDHVRNVIAMLTNP